MTQDRPYIVTIRWEDNAAEFEVRAASKAMAAFRAGVQAEALGFVIGPGARCTVAPKPAGGLPLYDRSHPIWDVPRPREPGEE